MSSSHPISRQWITVLPWLALGGFLLLNLPTFLCQQLDADTTLFDIHCRDALQGRIPYRDNVETNLPGMVWLQLGVRQLVGWRPEAIRFVDLIIVCTISWLMTRSAAGTFFPAARAVTVLVLIAFYFSTTEWCHCQRDMWMLLPSLVAVGRRIEQVTRLQSPESGRWRVFGAGAVEGMLWATAFWIKPYVVVPCLTCWIVSTWLVRRSGTDWWRIALDGAGVLGGGVAVGALGVGWLAAIGALPSFLHMMFVTNPSYVSYDATDGLGWIFLAGASVRFFPWLLVHLAAVPAAIVLIRRGRTECASSRLPTMIEAIPACLWAACYLGWLFQAVVMQHWFDYILAPSILLGLAVVLAWTGTMERATGRLLVTAFLACCVLIGSPSLRFNQLLLWSRCVHEGSTPELREALSRTARTSPTDLAKVQAYLEERGVRDGELTCFTGCTLSLYSELGLHSSTRYLLPHLFLRSVSTQRGEVLAEFAASRQRFVVLDLYGFRPNPDQVYDGDFNAIPLPAVWRPPSPWADSIVFRAGRYVVCAVDAADMPAWLDESFPF